MADLPVTAAGALLRRLVDLGVDRVFTNSGTDFPPIIEALAEAQAHDVPIPEVMVVPHEHVAMGMAHGYQAATGRAQAVILHTNVGLANGAIGAINAAVDRVPVVVMSGRTPVTERDRFGARTVPIGWGQEMRDQTALVREASKWDYELRFPEQIPELLDRAHAIASSTPQGPVYLGLPREVLSEPCPPEATAAPVTMTAATVHATDVDLARIAGILATATRPLIVAQRGAGSEEGFAALGRLVDRFSIPVCQYWAMATAVSTEHPTYVGQDPGPWMDADVVLVLDSLAPWMPDEHRPAADSTVIHLGPDPLFERTPVRNFRADVAVRGELGPALVGLERALQPAATADSPIVQSAPERRARIGDANQARTRRMNDEVMAGNRSPMSKAWVSHCLGRVIAGRRATVVSELGAPMGPLGLTEHGSWRQEPHSGGLGWAFPYAMGLSLADPDRLVVATMGDGSYLFSNPVACHQVAERQGIAVLTVVLDNGGYGAVRDSVIGQYPNGYAAKADEVPLTSIPVGGSLAQVAAACGVHAETVTAGDDLPDALARAVEVVTGRRRQALVHVEIG